MLTIIFLSVCEGWMNWTESIEEPRKMSITWKSLPPHFTVSVSVYDSHGPRLDQDIRIRK